MNDTAQVKIPQSHVRPRRVLVVDDELFNRKVLEGFLSSLGHKTIPAASGPEALELLDGGIDIVLLDVMMPDMDGFQVARAMRQDNLDIPIIMVTALGSKEDRLKAVECGANDFITKPVDILELTVRMGSLLKLKDYHDEINQYRARLEEMVKIRTKALQIANENLSASQKALVVAHQETLHCLAVAAEYKDDDTALHIDRMSRYASLLAEKMGFSDAEVDLVLRASPMHDIGKIGIPDSILLKPGKLDAQQWATMQTHTTIGASILSATSSEYLEAGRIIALTHHEKWDGSGYPEGLAGESIPVYGRICAVCDVFDALTSHRPYKRAFSVEQSLDIMAKGREQHFDPEILDLFMGNLDAVLAIKNQYPQEDQEPDQG